MTCGRNRQHVGAVKTLHLYQQNKCFNWINRRLISCISQSPLAPPAQYMPRQSPQYQSASITQPNVDTRVRGSAIPSHIASTLSNILHQTIEYYDIINKTVVLGKQQTRATIQLVIRSCLMPLHPGPKWSKLAGLLGAISLRLQLHASSWPCRRSRLCPSLKC